VKRAFVNRLILEIRGPDPVAIMRELDGSRLVEKTSLFGTAVHAVLGEGHGDGDALAADLRRAGVPVTAIAAVPPSLEDVFLDVVEKAGRPS
jgi:hypothetical protein